MTRDRPLLVIFDLVTSMGGVQKVMMNVLPRIAEHFRVIVIDAYDHPDYARALSGFPVERVQLGRAPPRRYIGGTEPLDRMKNVAVRAPWLLSIGLRLRRLANELRPAALYFNQLPSVAFFSRFIPRSGPAIIYHAHGLHHAHGLASFDDVRDGPRIARRCARVVVVSRAMERVMSKAGVDPSKITVIYNGVDPTDIRARARVGCAALPPREPGQIVLVQVAALAQHKQQHVAIEALATLPSNVVLWLCGSVTDGADRSYPHRLEAQARALGVAQRVNFLGWREDVPFVLAAADIAILTSREESFGMVLAEAMALGKPCVGLDVGGIPEVIEHGVTGWVSAPDAFAGAVGVLVASPEARAAMGQAGRRRVERLFTVERQAGEVARVLDDVVRDL